MSDIRERLATFSRSRLALLALELHERLEAQTQSQSYAPIAVVGMACRFPGHVTDAKSYWKLLRERTDAIREVPTERWDVDAIYDPDPEAIGKTYCRHGGFLDAIDTFDADFFGLSPREAMSMDPQQRLLLEVAWETLEDAGIAADRLTGTNTGVFIGAGGNDYSRLLSDPAAVDGYGLTGNALNALAGRISFALGLRGPSLVVDTACSSSLVAVHLAALSLRCGESRIALAGGVNLMLLPYPTVVTSRLRMLAPDGRCKAFDAAADGFVRSEGCGLVALKRLEDARRDGDRILAVLKSSAVNQDGASSGFTVPNVLAQRALIQESLRQAGVTPDQVHYVEAHGTGTSLGDPIELESLHEVLGNGSDRPLFVGSVKSNIGHLESAAGIAGFIKAVLALQHREIPGQVHFKQPTPFFDWDRSRLRVTPETFPWPDERPGVACVSSFGVSGTNAHVVLQEADLDPAANSPTNRSDEIHLLALSAKSPAALKALAARYVEQLADTPDSDLADFCYTVNIGRAQLPIRAAIVGTKAEIQSRLTQLAPNAVRPGEVRVAFLFSGQEIPDRDAGRELYEAMPAFREARDRCNGAAFAFQYASAEMWRSLGIVPESVCGFGPGETVALTLAQQRGQLILTPARRETALDELRQTGHNVFIEIEAHHDLRSVLDALAQAFVAGCSPRFEALYPEGSRRKISVPLYPFERRRYWLEHTTVSSAPGLQNLLYDVEWRPQANAGARDPRSQTAATATFPDCASFLELAQKAIREASPIVLVTRSAWQVENTDVANPEQAALWGMGRVLMNEHPDLPVTLVDVPASATAREIEEVLQHESSASSMHEQVAYRCGRRYAARLRKSPRSGIQRALRLDAQGTYLVTGGKGGIGRRLVQWLAERGAGRIVILTRSSPPTESPHEVVLGDVSRPEDVELAIACCGPNLKGIFHLAGVLDDGVLAQQTAARFARVMAPKASGAWNLHQQSLKRQLDFFVLFSSASAVLGTPGQANYAAANAFLDSLAQMRRGMGLPAHSIQWGPWAGTGMSESMPHRWGINALDPRTALDALENVLQSQSATPHMVFAADWAGMQGRSAQSPLLEDQLPHIQHERALFEEVRGLTAPDARGFLRREVAVAAARILRRDRPIGGSEGFFDAGMDSLMALELRNNLQSRLGLETTLPTSLLFDYPSPDQLGDYLAETLGVVARTEPLRPTATSRSEAPLAIVGMGCRFPGGIVNPETYWDALSRGVVAITEIPRDRWDIDAFYDPDPDASGKMVSRRGGFLDHIDQFDASFFGIAPREAMHMDPQQRLLLEVAWETLENAGIATDRLAGKSVGVFVGISSNDYLHRLGPAVQHGDAYLGAGNALSAAAGRLSYVMGWNGPSMAIDTACSSSLVAVHLACEALRDRRCRMAVAGGVNAILSPESNVQLSKARMLAPDGFCKAFDRAADGYVRGEGCGLVALKRLDDALADGDRIWAVIRGSAVNQDGRTAGLTVPSGPAQVAVIQEALEDAGLAPGEVQYVEAHGTGTSLGDPIELNALAAAYAGENSRDEALLVGSVKANLGHLESAAGIAGLMKAVLVLRHEAVPPQPLFHQPTPHIDWEAARLRVPVTESPLPAAASLRRAAVSSFGFVGTNAHVILEQAPGSTGEAVEAVEARQPYQVLTLSARTAAALEELRRAYLAAMSSGISLENLCFTANTGRARFSHRLALVAATEDDARAQLGDGQRLLRGTVDPETPVRLGLWFPEHSVTVDELKLHWLWTSSAFQAAWPESIPEDADPRLLGYLLSVALGEVWRSWGIEPSVVAGQGLGEIAATWFSGTLPAAEGLQRAQAFIAGRLQLAPSDSKAFEAAGCRLIVSIGPDAFAMFHALAELYVAGVNLDWARICPRSSYRKISIPTYPFQRQHFWPEEASRAAARPSMCGVTRHPLLGRRLHSPALTEVVFESHISSDSPVLVKDHLVYEKPILSGPSQLAMLMDAAGKVFPEGTYVASDVTFLNPNVLTGADGRTMQVILKLSGSQASFRIVSVACGREEDEAEWIVHSTGVLLQESPGNARIELDTLQRRYETESHVSAGALYDGLKQVGVTLGPAYRWIDEMRYVRGSSLARMRRATQEDFGGGYGIHPGLADSCFQTMAGGTGFDQAFAERGEASVPALVSQFRMFHSCERASWCHASLQLDHDHPGMTIGDWRLFDDDGKVLAEAKGVYLKRASRESLFRALMTPAAVVHKRELPSADWAPETIEAAVQQHVAAILRLQNSQLPAPREKLFDLGLDSLMAMELKDRLEAGFGRALPATLLFDYPTTGALTQYLTSLLAAAAPLIEEGQSAAPAGVPDIGEIQGMSEEELDDVVRRELESLLNRE